MTFAKAANGTPPGWTDQVTENLEWFDAWKKAVDQIVEPTDEPLTFEDAFNRIYDQAFDILVSKQEAYGPENIKELDFFGTFSRLASDKINRIRNLMKGEVINGTVYVQFPLDLEETVEDTLFDIMNYAAILISLRRGWWGKPLSKDLDFEGVNE